MAATPEQMDKLRPYLASEPDVRGEIEMHCPIHGDGKRSASVNPEKGVWYCHAGCGGGSIRRLIDAEDTWKPVPAGVGRRRAVPVARNLEATVTKDDVDRWHKRLMDDEAALAVLMKRKGISASTARRGFIGYNGRYFKIPVFGPERELLNVRTYDMEPKGGRRKIWSVPGMGAAQLYPIGVLLRSLVSSKIIICEGEWDTLLALQAGFQAVTHTDGAGKPWHEEWTPHFADRRVVIVPDRDRAGIDTARRTGEALEPVAQSVRYVNLPYEVTAKSGKDLSDYLLGQKHAHWYALGNLLSEAERSVKDERRRTRVRAKRANGRARRS